MNVYYTYFCYFVVSIIKIKNDKVTVIDIIFNDLYKF